MPEATRISFISGHQLVVVSAVINRTKVFRFIVDTGAQRIIISQAVAQTLGLDLAHPIRLEAIVTAERQTPPAPVVFLDSVQLGGMRLRHLEAIVFDLPHTLRADGLLGLNFLNRFRVTFEFDRSTVVLRPRPGR